ncbi:MAG: MerR family transcriptional regulator [Vicinamibacteria bacterium]|jgi:DNA-binding transcriptional MerR regulator|nr:MerR family transcriptional regulator [Vicinamibacteria bacterium]
MSSTEVENLYDLAQLCEESGVTQRTVRYYIQQGLLPSPGQPGPGAKYGEIYLSRLKLIRQLQRDHLPLAEIRRRIAGGPEAAAAASSQQVMPASGDAYARKDIGSSQVRATAASLRERSQWERFSLADDIELHVRRPLARDQNRRVERLLEQARQIFDDNGGAERGIELKVESRLAHRDRSEPREKRIVFLDESGRVGQPFAAAIERIRAADPLFFGHASLEAIAARGRALPIIAAEDEEQLKQMAAAQWPAADVRMIFTAARLCDNWFSHWDETRRTAMVSWADWLDGTFSVPAAAFLAYEIVYHGLRAHKPSFNPTELLHPDTRGCLFDLCPERADIEIKLQTADLCAECQASLCAEGLPIERIRKLTEAIRSLAVIPKDVTIKT